MTRREGLGNADAAKADLAVLDAEKYRTHIGFIDYD